MGLFDNERKVKRLLALALQPLLRYFPFWAEDGNLLYGKQKMGLNSNFSTVN